MSERYQPSQEPEDTLPSGSDRRRGRGRRRGAGSVPRPTLISDDATELFRGQGEGTRVDEDDTDTATEVGTVTDISDLAADREPGLTDSDEIEDDAETQDSPEHPAAPAAREGLLRRHALRQNILEATVTGVEAFSSAIHTVQDVKSAAKSFVLHARESRAQRRFERHANKAENSIFAFRRRKFARKAVESRRELNRHSNLVNAHTEFVERRQDKRDKLSDERIERVVNNREYLSKKSLIARERKQRRHEFLERNFTLVESREKELREKRKKQASMVKFRQAVFTNLQAAA